MINLIVWISSLSQNLQYMFKAQHQILLLNSILKCNRDYFFLDQFIQIMLHVMEADTQNYHYFNYQH